jgi:hypothetical protein
LITGKPLYKKEVRYIIAIVNNLLQADKTNKPEDSFRLIICLGDVCRKIDQ